MAVHLLNRRHLTRTLSAPLRQQLALKPKHPVYIDLWESPLHSTNTTGPKGLPEQPDNWFPLRARAGRKLGHPDLSTKLAHIRVAAVKHLVAQHTLQQV